MSLEKLASAIGRHAPALYRVAQPIWRGITKPFLGASYWERRRGFKYYREVIRLAKVHVPNGGAVIDVGAFETQVLQQLHWFGRRTALDQRYVMPQPGIETVVTDFAAYRPASPYDLVLCLQVLEHLERPQLFAEKLFATGHTVIISVPYKWPYGQHPAHLHDPVDETKLKRWTRRDPIETSIVTDDRERLIAVYRQPESGVSR